MMLRQAVALDSGAIYVTPRGKRCKWVPIAAKHSHLLFQYVGADHKTLEAQFTLAPANLGILRKVTG